jgi:hypothetical protein
MFGASLELGCWCLELLQRSHNRITHLGRADLLRGRLDGIEDVAGAVACVDGFGDGASMAAAASFKPKLWRSMSALDRICAIGFARFLPAMSGAVPPAGS